MFHVLLVGHAQFPAGVASVLSFVCGLEKRITVLNLDEHNDFHQLQTGVETFLNDHEQVLILADFAGGSPHTMSAELIAKHNKPGHFIVAGAGMGLIVEICFKALYFDELKSHELHEFIKNKLAGCQKFVTLNCNRDQK